MTVEDGTGTSVIARGSSLPKNCASFAMFFPRIAVTYSIAFVRSTSTA
ncbi:MAG: hypothetical protein H7138_27680 [Myxococcales bacterium]|nr:hypothetical protein [Myxococcales bacterium]